MTSRNEQNNTQTSNNSLPFGGNMPALNTQAELFKLLDSVGYGYWKWNFDSEKLDFSPQCEKILGFSGHHFPRLMSTREKEMHPDDRPRVFANMRAAKNGIISKGSHEFRALRSDGSYAWLQERFAVIEYDNEGKPLCLAGVINDITDIKKTEIETEASRRSLDHVISLAGVGAWEWNLDNDHISFSHEYEEILGKTSDEMDGGFEHLNSIMYEESVQRLAKGYEEFFAKNDDSVFTMDICCYGPNGTDKYLQVIASIVERREDGSPLIVCGGVVDINKNVRAQVELKKTIEKIEKYSTQLESDVEHANQTIAAMFDANPQINILFNENHKVIDCNTAAVNFFSFKNQSDLINNFYKDLRLNIIGDNLPVKTKKPTLEHMLAAAAHTGSAQFSADIAGKARLSVVTKRIAYGSSYAVVAYFNERTEDDEQMQAMFDATPLICSIWNEDGIMLDCNQHAVDVLECSSKQDYIDNFYKLSAEFQPDGTPSHEKASYYISETFRTGRQNFYWEYLTMKGEPLPVETTLIRVNWSDGYRLLAYSRDMREINKANAEILRQSALLQTVNNVASHLMAENGESFWSTIEKCLSVLGENINANSVSIWHNIKEQNGKLLSQRIYGWSKYSDFDPDENSLMLDINKHLPQWANCSSVPEELIVTEEIDENHQSSNKIAIDDTSTMLLMPVSLGGEFWGFISYEHEKQQYSLSKSERDILHSGGLIIASAIMRNQINQRLENATNAALASVKSKNEFLARMSHEIRTPMNAIVGMANIAKKSSDLHKINNALDVVSASSRQLLSLINDILDMSSIDLGKLDVINQPYDFEKMLENALDMVLPQIEAKQQSLNLDINKGYMRLLNGDEKRTAQVIINLLTNAVKFTPVNGSITLRVYEDEQQKNGNVLRIEVIDNGIGIKESSIDRIFEMFEQADGSITRSFGGTGLGLAISRRLVTLMGGDINVESTYGKGSRFIVELPAVWGEPCRQYSGVDELNGKRALLLTANMQTAGSLSNVLNGFGVKPTPANSFEAAEKLLETKKFDVVFLDWNLPRKSIKTAAKLLALKEKNTYVVALATNGWNKMAEETENMQDVSYIPKPPLPCAIYKHFIWLTGEKNDFNQSFGLTAPNGKGKNVLLVEDVEINRIIALELIEESGAKIDCAENGQQAVELFTKTPAKYDLILMDIQMPVMDGISATKNIRAMNKGKSATVPIYSMTANAYKEDEEACLAAGMNGHIVKPFEVETLHDVMRAAFEV